MNVSDYFQKVFNLEDNQVKLDLKVFSLMVDSNDYNYLIQITLALSKIVLGIKYNVSLPKLFKISSQPSHTTNQTTNFNVQGLTDAQTLQFFNCLLMLKEKLKNTIYQSKIRAIIEACQKKVNPHLKDDPTIFSLSTLDQDNIHLKMIPNINTLKAVDYLQNAALLEGKFSNPINLYNYLRTSVFPMFEKQIIAIGQPQQRFNFIQKVINYINKYIHQIQLEIRISKTTLIQTRIYNAKIETQILLRQQVLIESLAMILNEAILCPSSMKVQISLFRLVRRMYFLWGDKVRLPLFLIIKNISLYSSIDTDTKQVAMFCYKICQQKTDLQLANLLNDCEQMRFLKQSKYYSSKAFAFSSQVLLIYDSNNLQLPFTHYLQRINSSQIFCYNILVEKSSSMMIWNFYTLNYDIRFGIYKVQNAKNYSLDDYQKQNKCKEIVKFEKINCGPGREKQCHKGHLFLKNGLYRLVFDNSYSLLRGKDLVYMITHLQTES